MLTGYFMPYPGYGYGGYGYPCIQGPEAIQGLGPTLQCIRPMAIPRPLLWWMDHALRTTEEEGVMVDHLIIMLEVMLPVLQSDWIIVYALIDAPKGRKAKSKSPPSDYGIKG